MKQLFLFLFLCFGLQVQGQNSQREFIEVKKYDSYIEISVSDGVYKIQALSDLIFETTFTPLKKQKSIPSHAVVLQPTILKTQFENHENQVVFGTKDYQAIINKAPFQIRYQYLNRTLLSENLGFVDNDTLQIIDFSIDSKEALYGTGARALGMNRRGNRLELYNKAHYGYETHSELMNFTMPIVLSSKRYLVHFDNPQTGWIDLDSHQNNSLRYESIGGRKTYQVIAGDSWRSLMNSYTNLTGKQPIPPRWSLGNFASRFGYHSESEARAVVAKFKEDEIPLDAIIFDLYWFGKDIQGTMGNFEFLKDSFPEPKKMITDFNAKGVKTVLITEPFILKTSKKWEEAVAKDILGKKKNGTPYVYDFYFGTTGLIDIFKEEGKNWFWDVYKKYADIGVAGWWGDLGEPEVHPEDLIHANGTANEVHNVYGHYWAKLIAEGYKTAYPETRPFVLMRAGYSGSQRFGMIPWSGDVNRTWGGLQSQMEISLQMGMQGMAYMHSDLGGFAGNYEDDELYTRWLQYGVFQPVFRPHAQEELASEPIFKDDFTKSLAKKAIELRYQLLPYNYTLAFENNQSGMPFMRPLFFEEPENENLLNVASTYLWGNDLLVHPVVEKSKKKSAVYFPKTNNWFDFYSGRKYKGGTTEMVDLQIENIPVFVRGGALIPMIKTIQNTEQYSIANFDLHYYYDKSVISSKSQLYQDDGKTSEAFEKGLYEILDFETVVKKKSIILTIDTAIGSEYKSQDKKMNLVVHNFSEKPEKIISNGKKIKFEYANNTIVVEVALELNNKIKICL